MKMFLLIGLIILMACNIPTPPKPESQPVTLGTATWASLNSSIKLPPIGKVAWDWQIGATSESKISLPSGVKLIDLDGFNTSAAKVTNLKAQGAYVVCYIDVGSYETGRPDSSQYPASLKIYYDRQWGEWFLDVRDVFRPNSVLATILNNRLQMCANKGFDALEPDNLQNDENAGGLISTQEQLDFNGWIADAAHAHGLAVFQKNAPDKVLLKDRTGLMMVEKFDGILNEECQQYGECAPLVEYVKRGKLALNAEYAVAPNCTTSNKYQINTIRKKLSLVGKLDSGYRLIACP
jgi:hypothetical protein